MPGAVKIRVPCNCKLITNGEEMIPTKFPCPLYSPQISHITHIIPAAWSNLKSFILNPKIKINAPTFSNITECLNTNWTLNVPHINLTSTEDNIKELLETIQDQSPFSYSDTYGVHGDTLFLIWNSILSICIVYILFNSRHNLALIPTVRAETNTPIHYDMFFTLICLAFFLFIAYLFIKLFIRWRQSRNKPKRKENKILEDDKGKNSKKYVLEIDEGGPSQLAQDRSVKCTLHKHSESDDDLSLSE
ncbi:hypothetical protein JTB14_023878 [Gonioctena quinquepunctata]|nr:hypothetical protein JTB14_023878 [Gonioctena quinquepunctata]